MKCIHCQLDSKKNERIGGLCPGCQKPFAFDPTTGHPTDAGFQAAIGLFDQVKQGLARRGHTQRRCGVDSGRTGGLDRENHK